MKPIKLIFVAILLSGVVFGQHSETYTQSSPTYSLLNKKMPEFSAKDIFGKKYNSKTFANKVVFLNFWFTDCPPCIQEFKQLSDLYKSFSGNKDVIFLSISFDSLKDIKSFISNSDTTEIGGKKRDHFKRFLNFDSRLQYPIISSPDKKIEKKFKIDGWPTSFIVDRKGFIRLINIGLKLDEPEDYLFEKYSKKINELLAN